VVHLIVRPCGKDIELRFSSISFMLKVSKIGNLKLSVLRLWPAISRVNKELLEGKFVLMIHFKTYSSHCMLSSIKLYPDTTCGPTMCAILEGTLA
jgi:hypothetical protein